jgi:hypothetical protein
MSTPIHDEHGNPVSDATASYVARNRPAPKRRGPTPEAKVLADCTAYLEQCGFYVLRTSAALAIFGDRKMQVGRAGGHDITACSPSGRFVSVETKSAKGTPTPAQLRQRRFILRRNGIVLIPHSKAELRSGLIEAFGADAINVWERTDWKAEWAAMERES